MAAAAEPKPHQGPQQELESAGSGSTTLRAQFAGLRESLRTRIIGQDTLVDRMLVALLADGHLLVEGAPGLAKTSAIKALGVRVEGDYHRIQFTPDLLPADLTGTDVYRPQDGTFTFQAGPLFHNLLLADEINRAPAKVQSALLEAMAERHVTVGNRTWSLPDLFMVMATQNPIEQEGTYALPEAQLDRFLLYVRIGYPGAEQEQAILQLGRNQARSNSTDADAAEMVSGADVMQARREVLALHLSEALERYIVELVLATRSPQPYSEDLARWIAWGASPRATIGLDRAARAHAWINGRDYVSPADVLAMAPDVLRHRVLLSYEAEADGVDANGVVSQLLAAVPVP